jgi:hypothetical protein
MPNEIVQGSSPNFRCSANADRETALHVGQQCVGNLSLSS